MVAGSAPGIYSRGRALIFLSYLFFIWVFRENSYGASTIQIAEDQKVISTGPYAIVRHPMYAGALVMLAGIPLALGSWWGLFFLFLTLPILVWRLLDEERFLHKNLPGYTEYTPESTISTDSVRLVIEPDRHKDCCESDNLALTRPACLTKRSSEGLKEFDRITRRVLD